MSAPAYRLADANARLSEITGVAQKHYADGRFEEAVTEFQAALALTDRAPPNSIPIESLADLHARLANALLTTGRINSAADHYKAALRLVPTMTGCLCNLGNARLKMGYVEDAIALYLQALQINPGHWASRTNLVQALVAAKQFRIAKELLLELIAERPGEPAQHRELGKVCFELKELPMALQHFELAGAADPRDAESRYWIGGIRQTLGDAEAAKAAYLEAARIQPLIRRPATKSPPAFRVLALYAPFGGNTPTDLLFRDTPYETCTLALLRSRDVDMASIEAADCQLVVNLVSDADQAPDELELAADLVAKLGKPTINDPVKVMATTRDAISRSLQGIAGCRVPRTTRVPAQGGRSVADLVASESFAFPLLARPIGTHGGEDFEMFEDSAALAASLAGSPDSDHYLIEYLNYRSADGYFRKYRFIFVGERILPYHLAIGTGWKLHRDTTEMEAHPWMLQEEEQFLSNPDQVFSEPNRQALRTVRDRIGLNYFGIDCGIDAQGNLVIFEVNASMLVHDQNGSFTYKTPYVHNIKLAFDEMLGRLAKP